MFIELLESDQLQQKEIELLYNIEGTSNQTIERWLMSKEEIKLANKLVKKGYLEKGHADVKQKNVQYSLSLKGIKYLRNL